MPTYSSAELLAEILAKIPSSGQTSITAEDLRGVMNKMVNSMTLTVKPVTALGPVTVAAKDDIVEVNKPSNENSIVNLPTAPIQNKIYYVKDLKGNAAAYPYTITPPVGVQIDNGSTKVMSTNYGTWAGYFNGTGWKSIVA